MLPLGGIKVVDLSRALAGPYCTTMLADFGADVVKIESVGTGDPSRSWPPFDKDGRSLYFESVNRNKKSVTIDFYSPRGQEILRKLLENADVLVENFKFGTLEKIGFTDSVLKEINPEILHVSINAYGSGGPLRDLPGLDQVLQGATGITSVTGPVGGPGYRVGLPIVDITSGMNAAFAVVATLLGKQRGADASTVSTSLFESALSLSVFQGQQAVTLGEAPRSQGNNHPSIAPYGVYPTSSEPLIVAVSTEKHWKSFIEILGKPMWVSDARFEYGKSRAANRALLDSMIADVLVAECADYWIELFRKAGIPSGPIHDYKQAMESEQAVSLQMVQEVERQDGTMISLTRSPMSIDGEALPISSAPPLLGEHTYEVLAGLGISKVELHRLLESRVVSEPEREDPGSSDRLSEHGSPQLAPVGKV